MKMLRTLLLCFLASIIASGAPTTKVGGTGSTKAGGTGTTKVSAAIPAGPITFVSGTSTVSGSGGAGGSTTPGINTSGANLIVVFVSSFNAAATPTDFYSNTYTPLTTYSNSTSRGTLYYCYSPTTGSGHTVSDSAAFATIAVACFSNTTLVFDTGTGAGGGGSGTVQPGSITPASNNEVLVTGLEFNVAASCSINGGFSTPIQSTPGSGTFGVAISYLIQTTATAANPTWSTAGSPFDNLVAAMAAFK